MKNQINKALLKYLPKDKSSLSKAMRYSTMAGGKRFRPILCLEAAKLFGSDLKKIIPAAAAIEMIHTFTLIHDDLPAMDDSDLRRGKPTCHKVFGEDIAILAGDALNTLAFVVIAQNCDPKKASKVSEELGVALIRVVEGQAIDLESEDKIISYKKLEEMHLLKTSSLIEASLKIGAILAGASKRQISALAKYGRHLGLAFQITDDILDATSKTKSLGKPAGQDVVNNKSTYVSLLGLSEAKIIAKKHYKLAINELKIFGNRSKNLINIADFVLRRTA
ncbi:polyprenyl synthetase family protein [Candidatus Saganbacteria bacterium]|nr:polyprenyl synthetase family protein [Candidatus Saganbacteria bacterium]